jgi:hypothetical protein
VIYVFHERKTVSDSAKNSIRGRWWMGERERRTEVSKRTGVVPCPCWERLGRREISVPHFYLSAGTLRDLSGSGVGEVMIALTQETDTLARGT